jgi:hypothetical protein
VGWGGRGVGGGFKGLTTFRHSSGEASISICVVTDVLNSVLSSAGVVSCSAVLKELYTEARLSSAKY